MNPALILAAETASKSKLGDPFHEPYYWGFLILLLILLFIICYFLFWKGEDGLEESAEEKKSSDEATPPGSTVEEPSLLHSNATPQPEPAPDPKADETRTDEKLGTVYDAVPQAPDDLTKISGVGAVLQGKLNHFGVYKFEQIAGWDEEVVAEFSERLAFKDRVKREKWVDQAKNSPIQTAETSFSTASDLTMRLLSRLRPFWSTTSHFRVYLARVPGYKNTL